MRRFAGNIQATHPRLTQYHARAIAADALAACRGGYPHIHLKDVETVGGDTTRLTRWVKLVRQVADEAW